MAKSCMNICFTGNMNSTFVRRDYERLDKDYSTRLVKIPKDKNRLIRYLKIPIYKLKLFYSVSRSNILFSEFASWHSAIGVLYCKLLGKKSIIVVGGYDVANLPELKYGLFANRLTSIFPRFVFNHGDAFIAVSEHLAFETMYNMHKPIRNFYCLPRGHDDDLFLPTDKPRENMILTVAQVKTINKAKLKGLDTFVRTAANFRNFDFIIVGTFGEARDWLMSFAPGNVSIIGNLSQEKLVQYYQRAKVYCQLSMREGMPNVLCEAMLCECIPVGTPIPGIVQTIEGVGFYAEYGDSESTTEAINLALSAPDSLRMKERLRIMWKFPDSKRREGLHKIIGEVF